MKQCSDSLIFLLIDDTISTPDFESQEEIEENLSPLLQIITITLKSIFGII